MLMREFQNFSYQLMACFLQQHFRSFNNPIKQYTLFVSLAMFVNLLVFSNLTQEGKLTGLRLIKLLLHAKMKFRHPMFSLEFK